MKRWDVKLINKADRTDTVHTFTWADDWQKAMKRINDEMNSRPDIWDGWTYQISEA